jgi:hypothetical protein
MFPKWVHYYGKDEPPPERIALRAGPLSLIYEHGDLRYIRLGEREVVRRIYVAVRDRNWGTVPPILSNVQIFDQGDSFQITYDVTHQQDEIDFVWRGEISSHTNGTIHFAMDGAARSTFLRNRIGFCVLHPPVCAGTRAQIKHVDGTIEEAQFPRQIAPQHIIDGVIQPVHPFSDMRAVAHEVASGVWVTLRLEGEAFELEDQRNWIDGSFKTYGTPLRLPFPVEITAGTRITQAVTLQLGARGWGLGAGVEGQGSEGGGRGGGEVARNGAEPVVFTLQPASEEGAFGALESCEWQTNIQLPTSKMVLPRLGLGMASHGQALTLQELDALRALNLAHLRVDLRLSDAAYPEALRRAVAESQALGVSLEVALHLSDAAVDELQALSSVLRELRPQVAAWLVFPIAESTTGDRWVALAREYLQRHDPITLIGGGTNIYFTDLNRTSPPAAALDLICYSVNPQVHAFDNASLVETCETIAATVESAAALASGRPIAVTPITLKPRFNPVATAHEQPSKPDELPPEVDIRQMSLFGAGWTLAALKYLAESGVVSATFYETSGWRGVMEREAGSPLPAIFRSLPGAVFPLYHVFADAGEFAGGAVLRSVSSDPLRVNGLALDKDGRRCVLLANLTAERQTVTIRGLGAQVRVRMLDETNAEQAMRDWEAFRVDGGDPITTENGAIRLNLLPYAIVRIDVW